MCWLFSRIYTLLLALLFFLNAGAQVSLPLQQLQVNSPFGKRIHPVTGKTDFHRGVDLAARCDPILSIMKGTVIETGYNLILGYYIKIAHGEFTSIYGHLSFILVAPGESVTAGLPIGISGTTGRTTGEHLHFSIRFREIYLNPLLFLKTLLEPV